jgi:ribosomal protein S18 acetylase RimI-like enzyme
MARQRRTPPIRIRATRHEDFDGIIELSRIVYPRSDPWRSQELSAHLAHFPEGQLVAVDPASQRIVGMAASLRLRWNDYPPDATYLDHTARTSFANHDPEGETLYGAEVMVDPTMRRRRIGSSLYRARRELAEQLGIAFIRAGARLSGLRRHAGKMTAREYVARVLAGDLRDPTLSFQLRQGFRVIGIAEHYFRHDPQSLGVAAIIEWANPNAGTERSRSVSRQYRRRDPGGRTGDRARPFGRQRRSSPDQG